MVMVSTVPGGCHSQGCRGYPHALAESHILAPPSLKATKYEMQKPSTCGCATLFHCKFWSLFPISHLIVQQNICCGLEKVIVKSTVRVYFEQQILALMLVFHHTHNLLCNKCARALANQPISTLHFFNPQQMVLLQVTKLIMQGEKPGTSTETCNETMLCAKLRVLVQCISYFAALRYLSKLHVMN